MHIENHVMLIIHKKRKLQTTRYYLLGAVLLCIMDVRIPMLSHHFSPSALTLIEKTLAGKWKPKFPNLENKIHKLFLTLTTEFYLTKNSIQLGNETQTRNPESAITTTITIMGYNYTMAQQSNTITYNYNIQHTTYCYNIQYMI